MRASEAPGR